MITVTMNFGLMTIKEQFTVFLQRIRIAGYTEHCTS